MQTCSVILSYVHDPLYYSMSKTWDMSEKFLIVLQTIIPSVIMFGMPYVSFPLPQNSMERDHPSHNSDTDIYRSTLQSRHQHYHCHRLTNNARQRTINTNCACRKKQLQFLNLHLQGETTWRCTQYSKSPAMLLHLIWQIFNVSQCHTFTAMPVSLLC